MTGKPTKERRQAKRASLTLSVTFKIEGKECRGETLDVSTRGFFVSTEESLPVGATVPFTIEHEGLGGLLNVVGRVAHVMSGGRRGMGVEIRQIGRGNEAQFDALRGMVEKKVYGGGKR